MNWRERLASGFRAIFALDLRSLAVLRMGLGLAVLSDLWFRSHDFRSMYTETGFAPIEFIRSQQKFWQWSLHMLSGAAEFQAFLLIVQALVAMALLAGWKTRVATIASWALLTSLHVRLPVVLSGADQLLRMLLFWGMFLPLGAVWSLDARRHGPPRSLRVVSMGTAAIIVQMVVVYFASGLAKFNDDWLKADALGNILTSGLFSLPFGRMLARYDWLTVGLSRGTVWFETLMPLLLLVPFQTVRLRVLVCLAFLVFHIGIALTMVVGLFSFVALAAWIALVPGEVWDRLLSRRGVEHMPGGDGIAPSSGGSSTAYRTFWRRAGEACCAAALVVVLYSNWCGVARRELLDPVHNWLIGAARVGYLYQGWGMFGIVGPQDCWFAYEAVLKDGRRLDLLVDESTKNSGESMLTWQRIPNDRWRKLHWNLLGDFGRPYAQPLAEFVCRRWNETHGQGEQIVRFDLHCHKQPFKLAQGDDRYVRIILAEVIDPAEGGNFAEAVRESGEAF